MVIEAMLWGMHRPGTTDLVINGRFEELINKPMFRGLLNTKRCVVSLIISLPMLKILFLAFIQYGLTLLQIEAKQRDKRLIDFIDGS